MLTLGELSLEVGTHTLSAIEFGAIEVMFSEPSIALTVDTIRIIITVTIAITISVILKTIEVSILITIILIEVSITVNIEVSIMIFTTLTIRGLATSGLGVRAPALDNDTRLAWTAA